VRTLKVSSPYLRGDDVKRLQRNLVKHGYMRGQVDGEYGPLTAQGVYRAKYWLGYRVPDQSASSLLLNYLEGVKKPTPEMRKRTAQRKKAKPKLPLREKALREALKHIGVKESPSGSNKCRFSAWYQLTGPWCAMFISYCYVAAGSTAFKKSQRYAYVPFIVNDAHRGTNNLVLTRDPQPGDIVCFDWEMSSRSVADHVGLFVRWTNRGKGKFEAIEGNTSVGNDSNGGQVMRRDRETSQVEAFVHCAK
jgi:peptidoglycan hydrolase-like protein with peptidoglycan-binding domain